MPTAVAADPIAEAIERMGGVGEMRAPAGRTITDEFLHALNAKHENLAFQAASETEIIIAGPPGGYSPDIQDLAYDQVRAWQRGRAGGRAHSSARGYHPPGSRAWIPDASWMSDETLAEFKRLGEPGLVSGYLRITPDFVLEVRSPSQSLADQKQKMTEWAAAGVRLGLLIDPESKTAFLYRPDGSVEEHIRPATLSCEPEMPGLMLDFGEIWEFPWD